MTRLEKKLRASLCRLGLDERTTILVAVSGGADSTALLDAMSRLPGRRGGPGALIAAHLNHLLRGAESEADEAFVREMAARLAVPVLVERAEVAARARAEKRNLEATARQLRYDFLKRAAQSCGASIVATAHTRDDQIETILMRLLRGSGPEGLQGIQALAALSPEIRLIRPLLDATRDEVLAHCRHYGLEFRVDSSNFSPEFTRNRVRHELLPLLSSFNPRFGEALIRTAERIGEDEDYLSCVAAELAAAASDGPTIEIRLLRRLHPALRRRALRAWLRASRGDLRRIDAVHLMALDALATARQGGRYIELPGGWQVHRQLKRLILVRAGDASAPATAPVQRQKIRASRIVETAD